MTMCEGAPVNEKYTFIEAEDAAVAAEAAHAPSPRRARPGR